MSTKKSAGKAIIKAKESVTTLSSVLAPGLSLNQFNFSRLMKGMGECVGERDFNLEGVDGGNVRAHERAIK